MSRVKASVLHVSLKLTDRKMACIFFSSAVHHARNLFANLATNDERIHPAEMPVFISVI